MLVFRRDVLWYGSVRPYVRPSVNIWLSTGVTTCRINFNFTDIMHLVCRIHDTGNGPCSSLNMRILTQLLIFAFWSFLRPFLPEASILASWYCRCLRPSISPSVRHQVCPRDNSTPKLGSPNLDHRCKRPWLRSLLFWGWLTLTFKVKFNFNSKFTPFSACPCDNSSPVQARATKFGPEVQNTLVKIPIVLEVDWAWHVKFNLFSKSCRFA